MSSPTGIPLQTIKSPTVATPGSVRGKINSIPTVSNSKPSYELSMPGISPFPE